MDFYCRMLLEKLQIPKTKWNEYLEYAKTFELNINPTVKPVTFLGQPNSTGIKLSAIAVEELSELGIYPQAECYVKGLATLHRIKGRISLTALNDHLQESYNSEWLAELITAVKLIQLLLEEYLYMPQRAQNLELLVRERNKVYAQIACFCLPCSFLQEINQPTNFLEYLAPKLGQYIILQRNQ